MSPNVDPTDPITPAEPAPDSSTAAPEQAGCQRVLEIKTAAQWEAVTSPIRVDLIEFLTNIGPASVKDLAALLGRPADSLYYHIRKLQRAGIIEHVGDRMSAGPSEAEFRLAGDELRLEFDPATGYNSEEMLRLLSSILRLTERSTRSAFEQATLVHEGESRNLHARRELAWLTDADLKKVNKHLLRVQQLLMNGRSLRRGKLYSVTTFLMPEVVSGDERGHRIASPRDES